MQNTFSPGQGFVLLTPDQLRAIVSEAVADGIQEAKRRPAQEMTAEQVTKLKRVRVGTVLDALRDGSLKGYMRGRRWVIKCEDAEAWEPMKMKPPAVIP